MRPVRTAARALIIAENALLTVKMRDKHSVFYILPGGGQNPGETLETTLKRECREELGAEIEVGPLAYIREYIGRNHGFSQSHRAFHQVECVFRCHLTSDIDLTGACEQDKKQIGLKWITLSEIASVALYPAVLKEHFNGGHEPTFEEVYLGDVN